MTVGLGQGILNQQKIGRQGIREAGSGILEPRSFVFHMGGICVLGLKSSLAEDV